MHETPSFTAENLCLNLIPNIDMVKQRVIILFCNTIVFLYILQYHYTMHEAIPPERLVHSINQCTSAESRCTDLYYARGAQGVLPMREGVLQSIGSTVSDSIVRSWLQLTATRSSPVGCFSALLKVVDNGPHFLWQQILIEVLKMDFVKNIYKI